MGQMPALQVSCLGDTEDGVCWGRRRQGSPGQTLTLEMCENVTNGNRLPHRCNNPRHLGRKGPWLITAQLIKSWSWRYWRAN